MSNLLITYYIPETKELSKNGRYLKEKAAQRRREDCEMGWWGNSGDFDKHAYLYVSITCKNEKQ